MACPVCDHTMQNLGVPERRLWWCQRCGTLKEMEGTAERIELPLHLRHVLAAAKFDPPRWHRSQRASIDAIFTVHQESLSPPHITMGLLSRSF